MAPLLGPWRPARLTPAQFDRHQDSMWCLDLMGQEFLPDLREIGEKPELNDPFQKTP